MAKPSAEKPSFEELIESDVKKPSFEEISGEATKAPEYQIKPEELGAAEVALRTAREAARGATFQTSELLYGGTAGVLGVVNDLISKKDFDSAEKIINSYNEYYKKDIEQQEEFKKSYPQLSLTSELAGGFLTGAGAAKAGIGALSKAGSIAAAETTVPKFLLEAAKVGGATSAASKAGEQLYKAPYEQKPAAEQAKELVEAGLIGTAAGPVLSTGMAAATAIPYVAAKGVEKIGLSKPVLTVVQTIFGPRTDIMKKWYAVEREIKDIPDADAMGVFFDEVKRVVTDQKGLAGANLDEAVKNLETIETRLAKSIEISEGVQREKLSSALSNLKSIQDDLLLKKGELTKQASIEKQQLGESLKDPSMGPYVNTVQDSLKELQSLITEGSQKARDAIDPDFRMPKQKIIQYANDQIKNLGVQGTGAALTDSVVAAQNKLKSFIDRVQSNLPDEINGNQVKDILKQIDMELEYLVPGTYGTDTGRAFYNLRVGIDKDLKVIDSYREAMIPVAQMRGFLDTATRELSSPGRIETALRKAKENPRIYNIFQGLRNYTGVDLEEPIIQLQKRAELRLPGALAAQEAALPSVQELEKTSQTLSLTRIENFREKVFSALGNSPEARAIIQLREQIESLSNPAFRRSQTEADVMSGRMSLQSAAMAREEAELANQKAIEKAKQFLRYEKGGQAVETILRAPLKSEESVKATMLIDAVSRLPEEQFVDLFNLINLNKPSDFKKFAELFRLEEAMSRPFVQGSRRTVMVKALGSAIGSMLGYENAGFIGSALGAFTGAYIDVAGPAIAKMYLRALSRGTGIPSAPKLEAMSPIPITSELRNLLKLQMVEIASGLELEKSSYVDESKIPFVINDIQRSDLSNIEKAKAIKSLNYTQTLSNKTIQKIILAGDKPLSEKRIGVSFIENPKAAELSEDKPDVLKLMSRKIASEQYPAMEEQEDSEFTSEDEELDPKRDFEDLVTLMLKNGYSREEAEIEAERLYGRNPYKEDQDDKVKSIFEQISKAYQRLQEQGQVGE